MARGTGRWFRSVVGAVAFLGLSGSSVVVGADVTPPIIAADAPWLETVNYFRAMAGLPAVTEDAGRSAAARLHSCYMLRNGMTHEENPALPGFTPEGLEAGRTSDVTVSSAYASTSRSHISFWMTGPFHSIGILRPNLQTVGYGQCDDTTTPKWHSAATLDVIHGLGPNVPQTAPILWPGPGTTTDLSRFVTEQPDPLQFCGYPPGAGLPLMALMPESVGTHAFTSIKGPSGPVKVCTLSELNTTGEAHDLLAGNNAVVAIPRKALKKGTYTVTITTTNRTVSWSFTVDPAAAGTRSTLPTAAPDSDADGFTPMAPVRVVDTREDLGGTRLLAGEVQQFHISGVGGIGADASAISANLTVTGQAGPGFMTAWDCSITQPDVATVNFAADATTANGAAIPLSDDGDICVNSLVDADLVLDVNGYFAPSSTFGYTPIAPSRLLDTRPAFGGSGRIAAGSVLKLAVGGKGGIPADARAAVLNLTTVQPARSGYVTAWPCDQPRPFASSINPTAGNTISNLAITAIAGDGTICFFSFEDVDLVVDATGYMRGGPGLKFVSSTPFRFVDTRDERYDLSFGTDGQPLPAKKTLVVQIAGSRGIPSNAKSVSVNLAAADATADGYLTVWPCDGARPNTANLTYRSGEAVSNGAKVGLSSTGKLCVFTWSTANVIVDVNGFST